MLFIWYKYRMSVSKVYRYCARINKANGHVNSLWFYANSKCSRAGYSAVERAVYDRVSLRLNGITTYVEVPHKPAHYTRYNQFEHYSHGKWTKLF